MLYDFPDITGTGAAVALASSHNIGNVLYVSTPAANTAAVRLGQSTVSASRGVAIPPGSTALAIGPISDGQWLDLAVTYAFIGSGDKLTYSLGRK